MVREYGYYWAKIKNEDAMEDGTRWMPILWNSSYWAISDQAEIVVLGDRIKSPDEQYKESKDKTTSPYYGNLQSSEIGTENKIFLYTDLRCKSCELSIGTGLAIVPLTAKFQCPGCRKILSE